MCQIVARADYFTLRNKQSHLSQLISSRQPLKIHRPPSARTLERVERRPYRSNSVLRPSRIRQRAACSQEGTDLGRLLRRFSRRFLRNIRLCQYRRYRPRGRHARRQRPGHRPCDPGCRPRGRLAAGAVVEGVCRSAAGRLDREGAGRQSRPGGSPCAGTPGEVHGRAGGVHRVAADRGQGLAGPPPLAGRLFLRPRRPGADHFLEQLHRDRPELQARSLGARPQRQRARRRPGPHGRRRGAPGAARAGGQHRPRLRPALVAVRRDGHRQGHAATAARHPRPGPASPARRHRHAFRGQPGGSAAARDRAPHRGDRRRNPAHPQPARRPGRQGPGRRPHDPPAKPEPGGAAEPAQRLAGRTARSPPGCGRPPLAGRRPGQGRGRGARRLLPQRRPDGLGRLQPSAAACWSSSAAPSTPTAPARR